MSLEKELKIVKKALEKAGKVVLSYYKNGYSIKNKEVNDCPVTEADIKSNEIIIEKLTSFGYGILSEEITDDLNRLKEEKVWIIDPLDGTKDFINKTDDFTIMVGLVEREEPILGAIYHPTKNILYYGVKNKGAYIESKNGLKRLRVSDIDKLRETKIISSRFHCSELEKRLTKNNKFKKFIKRGSSLKICEIAEGKAELNINPSDKTWEWDICAADIILTEAGGKLTDVNDEKFIYNKKNPRNNFGYVASNGLVHNAILKEIKDNNL